MMKFFTHAPIVRKAVVFLSVAALFALPIVAAAAIGVYPGNTTCNTGDCKLVNPLGNNVGFPELIKKVLDAVMIIGLPIAVLFIVYAGFMFVMARGNTTKLEEARRNFLYVIIGTAVFLGAWAISQIIANTLRSFGAQI